MHAVWQQQFLLVFFSAAKKVKHVRGGLSKLKEKEELEQAWNEAVDKAEILAFKLSREANIDCHVEYAIGKGTVGNT